MELSLSATSDETKEKQMTAKNHQSTRIKNLYSLPDGRKVTKLHRRKLIAIIRLVALSLKGSPWSPSNQKLMKVLLFQMQMLSYLQLGKPMFGPSLVFRKGTKVPELDGFEGYLTEAVGPKPPTKKHKSR